MPECPSQAACVFEYLYRDAGNWKTYGEILLAGKFWPALRDELTACCEMDALFVAEQVHVEPLQPKHHVTYGEPSELDHAFHEFVDIRAATAGDIGRLPFAGQLNDLVMSMHAARDRWNCALSPCGWL